MPLTAEEYGDLSSKIPYFDSNPVYGYLAEKKLLPQQRGLESFEDAPLLTTLRRKLFGHTRAENQLIKQQQEAIIPFEQEQEIQRKLKAAFDFQQQHAPTLGQASAIMPALSGSATPDQQVRPLIGTMSVPTELVPPTFDIDRLQPDAARAQLRNANYNAYALSASPSEINDGSLTEAIASGRLSPPTLPSLVPPERQVDVYGQPIMDPNARMNPAQLAAYQSMLAGHIVDPTASLQPPAIEAATISARGAMEREMLSPAQQKNVLKNMVAAGQLDQAKYEAMLPNIQQPLQKAAFDTFLRELTAGSSTTKSLNDLSLGLFGKNADQIGPDELVTPEDQRRVQQHGLPVPQQSATMTRHTLLSSLKNIAIPKNIYEFQQGQQLQRQIAAAGPVAEAGARSTSQVKRETELSGGVSMLNTLTDLQGKLFTDASADMYTRNKKGFDIRTEVATNPDVGQWVQMSDGLRAQLARIGGEVGNLAQAEQERAVDLIPDPFGKVIDRFPFWKGPDTKQVAKKKLTLLGEFLQTTLEAPKGPDAQSRVQTKLRGVLKKLDEVDPPVTGAYSDAEKEARYQRWKKAHPGK